MKIIHLRTRNKFNSTSLNMIRPNPHVISTTLARFPKQQFRYFHPSTRSLDNVPPPTPQPNQIPDNNSLPSFNLWQQIREARPAVRYTVYAGLSLMALVETTFWVNVLEAKFFPSGSEEERAKSDDFLQDLRLVVKGYRAVWMRNYGRYYGAYLFGVGYGGLDGL